MPKKKSESSEEVDLKAQCEAYKHHLEKVIGDCLIKKLAGDGLSEVEIRNERDVQKFGEIRSRFVSGGQGSQAALSAAEIDFIANQVINKDPNAKFYEAHPALSVAIQKYRAVNDLLAKVDDTHQFRAIYRLHIYDLMKEREKDPVTQHFINTVGAKIGVQAPALAFFVANEGATNDQGMVTDKPRVSRGHSS